MSASHYFLSLHDAALVLADRLPLERDFASMTQVTGVLSPAVKDLERRSSPFSPPPISVLADVKNGLGAVARRSAGLNTVGMLLDRLSILAMKHWALIHRSDSPEKAAELRAAQVEELAMALSEAQPGSSSINNKMTSHVVRADASTFEAAFFGLFTTNLLLWESQEVLYHHDLTSLPCEELRAYIRFFSEGNLRRNAFIQSCDQMWWALVESAEA